VGVLVLARQNASPARVGVLTCDSVAHAGFKCGGELGEAKDVVRRFRARAFVGYICQTDARRYDGQRQDVPALLAGQVPSDIAEAGLLTNPIHVLDLALVLPAAILTGVLLARRRPWGYVLGAYFLVKFTTLGLAIMSMSVFMVADGQSLSVPLVVVFGVWTAVSALLAWWFLSNVGALARPFGHLKEASR
jgi:hypothetical protein